MGDVVVKRAKFDEIEPTRPIYLDYNGTCPMDAEVCETIFDAVASLWENPSSVRGQGKNCKAAIEKARRMVAKMINASAEEIIFTSGGTEANNMVCYSSIEEFHRSRRSKNRNGSEEANGNGVQTNGNADHASGDHSKTIPHIISSSIEHDSISKLLNHLESKHECDVTRVPVERETGAVSHLAIIEAVRSNTCLITVMLANNETGVLQPVGEIADSLRDLNSRRASHGLTPVRLHTDAAQAIGKIPVDATGVDFLTIVGHKFYGPRSGALFVRKGTPIHPLFFGGGQERNIRPGTENTPMIAGLGKAAEIVTMSLDEITKDLRETRDHLERRLKETVGDGVVIHFGSSPRLPNTSSVAFRGCPGTASDLLAKCTRVVASTGATCHSGSTKPSSVLLACGVPEELAIRTIRFSVGRQTTKLDVDEVVKEVSLLAEANEADN